MNLRLQGHRVANADDFVALVRSIQSATANGDFTDANNITLERFLEAMSAWVESYLAARPDTVSADFDWHFAAQLMLAGWDYE